MDSKPPLKSSKLDKNTPRLSGLFLVPQVQEAPDIFISKTSQVRQRSSNMLHPKKVFRRLLPRSTGPKRLINIMLLYYITLYNCLMMFDVLYTLPGLEQAGSSMRSPRPQITSLRSFPAPGPPPLCLVLFGEGGKCFLRASMVIQHNHTLIQGSMCVVIVRVC